MYRHDFLRVPVYCGDAVKSHLPKTGTFEVDGYYYTHCSRGSLFEELALVDGVDSERITVFDVYSLFSSRYAIFEMINDFKDDVRLHDIVKFNKYDRTFRVYIVLDGDDLSLFNAYRHISIEDFSIVRNKLNTFNSVLSGYYLETRIKDIEEYLNKCVISTVIIGD